MKGNYLNLKNAKIIRAYKGFIILAQSEEDYNGKRIRIDKGDTKGFYRSIAITQFQGEDRQQAIINSFCLDIEEEDEFFEYIADLGFSINEEDDKISELYYSWLQNERK